MITNNEIFINSVIQTIGQASKEISQRILSRKEFHRTLQQKIVNLANSFNLKGISEYCIRNVRTDGRGGSIDVIWTTNLEPFAIFEIDSAIRIKSIKKLLFARTSFRFWVYYGHKNFKSIICKYDPNNLIKVIKLQNVYLKERLEIKK